jgi:hypothetical protein
MSDTDDDLHDMYIEHVVFSFKSNNPSVRHPVRHPIWPLSDTPFSPHRAPHLAPVGHPVWPPVWPPLGIPSGPRQAPRPAPVGSEKKIKIKIFIFGCCCRLEKRGKNISVFGFQSPRSPSSPSSPSSAGFAGKAARRRFFRPSSPSHPSKLYSSLGWLNSKDPKPFFPFSLSLIDVGDGYCASVEWGAGISYFNI